MKKVYFIHVPKTAGSFIKACYGNYKNFYPNTRNDKEHKFPHKVKRLGNTCEAWMRAPDNDYFPSYSDDDNYQTAEFTFSIVRNPFDWLVSYYHHSSRFDDGWANVNNTHNFKSFKQFIMGYASMPSDQWHVPFLSASPFGQVIHNGIPMVDMYFKQENLSELFSFFDEKLGMKRMTSGVINKSQKRKSADYRSYYDNEMVDIISKKMENELILFDYEF